MTGPATPPEAVAATSGGAPADGAAPLDRARADLLVALLAPLSRHRSVALAVSGGSDSVALMHIAATWRDNEIAGGRSAPELTVLTVDHGLREASAAEAREVAAMAAAAGHAHLILTWSGAKPVRGVQAAARVGRYALIEEAMAARGIEALVTAHTADDQAETLLMRLARASGPDGLAAMRAVRVLPGGALHYRPFLAVTKAELAGELRRRGASWIEDPSNENAAFERVRLRQSWSTLAALGLSSRALATSAARTGRLVALADRLIDDRIRADRDAVTLWPTGYAEIRRDWLEELPAEARLRLLAALIHTLGGAEGPPPIAALEAQADALGGLGAARGPLARGGFTLAGALLDLSGERVLVMREPLDARRPRAALPAELGALPLAPGQRTVWDRRFALTLDERAPPGLVCGPLGPDGLGAVIDAGHDRPQRWPARVLRSLPAIFSAGRLAGVPHLGVWLHPRPAPVISVRLWRRLPYPSVTTAAEGSGRDGA